MPASAPVSGAAPDGSTLTILEPGPPDTLDPLLTRTAAGADAAAGVFDSLVRLDARGTPRPDLAARWHRSVDARTWTFYVNPRARWQDGEPVSADDVAFTARLVRDARFGATSTRGFDVISSIVISASNVVTVTLSIAFAPFLATFGTTPILPAHVLSAIPPRLLRAYIPFNRRPIGSGPFAVTAFTPDGRVVEEANPDYFGGGPHLDRLIIAPAASRAAALAQAHSDGMTLLPPSLDLAPSEAAPFTGAALARALYAPSFAWTHLDLIEHGALADPLVRRALALATPRDRIIRQVLRGHGRICDGDQAPGTPAYEPAVHNSYRFSPRAARLLLQRAGYLPTRNGRGGNAVGATGAISATGSVSATTGISATGSISATGATSATGSMPLTITLWGDATCATCAATLKLIAQGWTQAGVRSRIRLVPTDTLFGPRGPLYSADRFQSAEYDAVLYAWVNGPDPDDSAYWTLGAIVGPAHPLGGNFGGYHNAALDYLATRALITPNGPSRYAFYRRIQRILAVDVPDVFLYWADNLSIVPRRLRGYSPNPYATAATWNAGTWSLTSR